MRPGLKSHSLEPAVLYLTKDTGRRPSASQGHQKTSPPLLSVPARAKCYLRILVPFPHGRPPCLIGSFKVQSVPSYLYSSPSPLPVAEIERTLKKVSEGLEIFHETLEKLETASSPAQKEKVEVELKKEIKKLQRLRDQIKTWQQLSELKDKQAINEARRSIELEMERFKVLEKEMKIKAYSKEGLSQAAKLDPREMEKLKVAQWINTAVDRLGTQTDALEAELEALQIQAKKTKRLDGAKQERLDALPDTIERHKMHVRRLEKLLRLMENDKYGPEQVNEIKDDVEYYVESNQDPDFIPDENLYDQFELVDDEESEDSDDSDSEDEGTASRQIHSPPPAATAKPSAPSAKGAEAPSTPSLDRKKSCSHIETKPLPLPIQANASSGPAVPAKTSVPAVEFASSKKPASATVATSLPAPPTIKNMAATIASTAGVHGTATVASLPAPVPIILPSTTSNPSVQIPKVSGPSFASAIAAASGGASVPGRAGGGTSFSAAASYSASQAPPSTSPSSSVTKTLVHRINIPGPYEELYAVIQRKEAAAAGKKTRSTADLLAIVEASFAHCPDGSELERSRSFTPKQPFNVPSYYPSHPPAILENPAIFERFELDTLFFIFYYQQKTYAQYLAARELKRQSWRFHKKYLTWFQRHEEPKTITDEYEQGTYIYFDYEGNWCQRKKSEFTFEYRYLEDEETV